jgi:hypothetical protein
MGYQIAAYFEGLQVDPGAVETPISTGYAVSPVASGAQPAGPPRYFGKSLLPHRRSKDWPTTADHPTEVEHEFPSDRLFSRPIIQRVVQCGAKETIDC